MQTPRFSSAAGLVKKLHDLAGENPIYPINTAMLTETLYLSIYL